MLEQSKEALAVASAEERKVAEIVAFRYLTSELEENLLPSEEAAVTAQAHREAGDETWHRAVFGMMLGIRAAAAEGYRLTA